MAKTLFKGIQQVTMDAFNAAEEKKGYLWFVREPQGENTGLGDDKFHIYFGTRCYGSFWEGEHEALAASLTAIKDAVGLGEDFSFAWEGATTVVDAFDLVKSWYDGIDDKISDALEGFLIKDIDANDKVLSVADYILSAKVGLKYENGRISLTGKDGVEIQGFDASEFVKDSVLEDVKVETREDNEKYIVFTWKTEGEEAKTDEIKVSDFAKLYNAGTALELAEDGVTFNVKVAENGNFLSVNDNNELIVDDVTTDKTMIKEAITIEGGPLASDAVKAAFTGGVIPAGTDIQAVLKALLCVEIYPVPTKNTPDYSVSITAPSISSDDIATGKLVEIGQEITFKTVSAKNVTIDKTEPLVEGFEHGYSESVDGDVVESDSISAAWTVSQKEGEVFTLSASATGFTGTLPTTVTATTYDGCVLASCTLTAVAGTNKYAVTEDAPKHVGSHTGITQYYVVSNLGGRKDEEKSIAIEAESDVERDAENKTATFTVTGVYPMYTNGVSASTTDATAAAMADLGAPVTGDGTKLALQNKGTFAVSFANQGQEPYRLFLPTGWTISAALAINPTTAKYAVDCKSKFVTNGTTTRTVQGNTVTYNVYEWASTEGPNRVKFTVA